MLGLRTLWWTRQVCFLEAHSVVRKTDVIIKYSYKLSNLKNRNSVPNFPAEVMLELRCMKS